jgi:hypothetical protein
MASDVRYRSYWLSARARSFRDGNDYRIGMRMTDLDVQILRGIPGRLVVVPFLYWVKRRRGMKRIPNSKRHSPIRKVAVFWLCRARFDRTPSPSEGIIGRAVRPDALIGTASCGITAGWNHIAEIQRFKSIEIEKQLEFQNDRGRQVQS